MIRLRPPRVIPIEVWDVPVNGQPLQAWRHDDDFAQLLARLTVAMRAQPPDAWSMAAQARMRTVDHVHLLGGGAVATGLADAFATVGLRVTIAVEPRFAAVRAGSTLVPGRSVRCFDVGQTSVKCAIAERIEVVDRDWCLAPFRDDVPMAERGRARASTIRFLAAALATGTPAASPAAVPVAAPVVVALPCEIEDDGTVSGCSLCWDCPDPRLLAELAQAAGIIPDALYVLNDAELAAVAAAQDPRCPRDRTTLVLTLGFGVGGALLEPA